MTLEETREALALAAGTVSGLTGYQWPPAGPTPGDAWPSLTSIDHNGFREAVWAVVVVLGTGSDFQAADEMFSQILDPLEIALTAAGLMLTETRPGSMPLGGQQILVAEFSGRADLLREET